jgi:maleylpyruvate isomerase
VSRPFSASVTRAAALRYGSDSPERTNTCCPVWTGDASWQLCPLRVDVALLVSRYVVKLAPRRRRGGCRRTVACVDRPTEDIDGCQAAHSRLAAAINDLPDAVVRQPSLLPDWTVGHVLTHLARNAEAMVRRIEAATRGELIDQYPGGARGRAAEIEAGADRPAHELITDVRNWAQRLDAVFGSLPDDLWNHQVRSLQGSEHPIAQLPFHRWWEVEVHLVDLGIGLTPDDWTQQLVDRALPWLIAGLRDRADDRSLMAWMLGRSSPPNLDPWR